MSKYKSWGFSIMSSPVLTGLRAPSTPLHPDSHVFPYAPPHSSKREPIACGHGKRRSGRLHAGGFIWAGPWRVGTGGKGHSRKRQPHKRCELSTEEAYSMDIGTRGPWVQCLVWPFLSSYDPIPQASLTPHALSLFYRYASNLPFSVT